MLITAESRRSTLATCMEAAPNFQLGERAATEIITDTLETVRAEWQNTCQEAELSEVDRNLFWGRIFFNPSIFE